MSADARENPSLFVGLDEEKAALLDRVASKAAGGAAGDEEATAAFLRRYYRHVATEDIVSRRDEDVVGAAFSHRELALHRPQGTASVRVTSPAVERDGWTAAGHSVVEVVADDMPFLVDSVTAELTHHGRAIHLVVHPTFAVRRDVAGTLIEVSSTLVPSESASHELVESWMHIEVDRGTDETGDDVLTADLERVLRDVR